MRLSYISILGLLLLTSCIEPRQDEPAEQVAQDTVASAAIAADAQSFDRRATSIGQRVYVPVYSHIYQQDRQKTFNLTTTLSIRNADPYRSFRLTRVSYYDSKGNVVQEYLDSEQLIKPLASTSFVIEEADLRGGVGANFLVHWESEEPIFPPVIEAVNISTSQQQGISFLSVGRVLEERSSTGSENEQ